MWIICICLPFLYASFFFSFYLTYFLPSRIIGPMCFQARCHRKWLNLIFRSSPERWPNKPGKNVRPYIHMSTMKHNAATNQIMIFVKVDETFTMIWLSRSSEVRVKVMWDLKFQKWRFSNSVSSTIFQPVKKFQQFLILDQNISGRIFEFSPSYQVTWLQILPKNTQKFFPSNETWYDVRGRWDIHDDMTFKVIRGQGQGQEMTSVPFRHYFYLFIHVHSNGSKRHCTKAKMALTGKNTQCSDLLLAPDCQCSRPSPYFFKFLATLLLILHSATS